MLLQRAVSSGSSLLLRTGHSRLGSVPNWIALSHVNLFHQTAGLNQDTVSSGTGGHRPDKWDKRYLVWTKKYPSIDQIPPKVSESVMDKARNQIRIRINIAMCVLTALVSFSIILIGKKRSAAAEAIKRAEMAKE